VGVMAGGVQPLHGAYQRHLRPGDYGDMIPIILIALPSASNFAIRNMSP